MAQWIKPNINIDFVGASRAAIITSSSLVALSILALIGNALVRGEALNYGTDFKGGSEIQVEFSRAVGPAQVRSALSKAGFKDAEVVRVSGSNRKNFFLLRLSQVSGFSQADRAKVSVKLKALVGAGNLRRFDYKSGSDKVYVYFKRGYKLPDPGEAPKKKTKAKGEKVQEIDTLGRASAARMSKRLAKLFDAAGVEVQQVQRFGRAEDNVFEVILAGLDRYVRKIFDSALGAGVVKDVPQVESVGAKMGRQLRDDGVKSVVYALLLMLIYIAFRFDFRYAPGAVVALIHDVIITVGIFAVTWQEFSLSVVAALLTIAGYSVNDTIVVYDRIRENVAKLRDRKFGLVVNASINETLSRTLLTSLTTLFTCVSIWVVGTGVLHVFAFALTLGVVVGTYSSIFIASPLVVYLNARFASQKKR